MSKTPELNIYKRPEKPKPYYLNISAKLSDTGKRTALAFKTLTGAKNAKRKLLNKLNREGKEGYTFTKKEAVDAKRALALLKDRDDNLHDLVREALEARDVLNNADLNEGYELSILKASRRLVEHYKHKEQARTFAEVYWDALKTKKQDRGSNNKLSTAYLRDLDRVMKGPKPNSLASDEDRIKGKGFLHHFGSTLIDEITEDQVREFLANYFDTSDYNYNFCISAIRLAFTHALKKRWIPFSPMDSIKKRSIDSDVCILSIKQFNRCIELIQSEKYQGLAVPVAIMMFAGIRPEELAGNQDKTPMAWDRVVMHPSGVRKNPYIKITKSRSKTSPREVVILDVLAKWIETVPVSERKGTIIPRNHYSLMKKFRTDAGIAGMKDIFRHSFGTYHYEHFKSQDLTMHQMGHSDFTTFKKHYHDSDYEENAPYLYWELLPEGAEKETNIVKPAFKSGAR